LNNAFFTASFIAHRQAFLFPSSFPFQAFLSKMSFQKLLSADAPEFIPSALVIPAIVVPEGVPLTFSVYRTAGAPTKRTFDLMAMKDPRTKSLQDGPLYWIGKQVRSTFDEAEADNENIELGCHDNDYRLESIVRPMPAVAAAPLGDFPKNIQDYYWVNDGTKDEHPWYLLARLSNGTFVFMAASCAFSGFECQGQIHLYAAGNLQDLYDHGMGEAARFRFACCFDKGTRDKVAADKAARQSAYKAQRAAQQAQAQAQRAVQVAPQVERARIQAEAQAKQAYDAAFAVLDARVARWQQMSDSDHEREEERMEAFRDRMREKSGRY
jgi:hypothetical protein